MLRFTQLVDGLVLAFMAYLVTTTAPFFPQISIVVLAVILLTLLGLSFFIKFPVKFWLALMVPSIIFAVI
jgi:hypothetical protein